MNTGDIEIKKYITNSNLKKKDGYLIFHLYFRIWNN